jgi:hypothetical protein
LPRPPRKQRIADFQHVLQDQPLLAIALTAQALSKKKASGLLNSPLL